MVVHSMIVTVSLGLFDSKMWADRPNRLLQTKESVKYLPVNGEACWETNKPA
jgi:hypothetical protein